MYAKIPNSVLGLVLENIILILMALLYEMCKTTFWKESTQREYSRLAGYTLPNLYIGTKGLAMSCAIAIWKRYTAQNVGPKLIQALRAVG